MPRIEHNVNVNINPTNTFVELNWLVHEVAGAAAHLIVLYMAADTARHILKKGVVK